MHLRRTELHGSTQRESSLAQAQEADVLRRKTTSLLFVLSSCKLLSHHSFSHPKVCTDRKELWAALVGTSEKLKPRLSPCQPPSCTGLLLSLELAPILLLFSMKDQQGILESLNLTKLSWSWLNKCPNKCSAILLSDSHSEVRGGNVCVKHSSVAKNIVLLLLEQQGGSHAISGQGPGGLCGRQLSTAAGGKLVYCQQPGTEIKT